jgi:ABC-type amino acid transport system permease subunit
VGWVIGLFVDWMVGNLIGLVGLLVRRMEEKLVGLVVSFLVAWTRKTPRMLVPVSAKRMIKKHEVK